MTAHNWGDNLWTIAFGNGVDAVKGRVTDDEAPWLAVRTAADGFNAQRHLRIHKSAILYARKEEA